MTTKKWVSVQDRLPEINQPVLIVTSYGKMDVCYRARPHAGLDYVDWTNHMRPQHSNGSVTHWQPLPDKPLTSAPV